MTLYEALSRKFPYGEMEYELTHPEKVRPYFDPEASLFEKEPIRVYRWAFLASLTLNILLLLKLLSQKASWHS